jgi:hypothetical protein
MHLENRIESAVLNFIDYGQNSEAIELCKTAFPYNEILAHRYIELLRGAEEYEESIKLSNQMICQLASGGLSFEQFAMANAKCYKSLGEYLKSSDSCKFLLHNPSYSAIAYLITSLNSFATGKY